MAFTVEEIRAEILLRLRNKPGPNVDWYAQDFEDLAPNVFQNGINVRPGAVDVYTALWQLVQQGIIIPGHRSNGRFSHDAAAFGGFPFFSLTQYGHGVLANLQDDVHPADAVDYLKKLQLRAPSANETALRYVGES